MGHVTSKSYLSLQKRLDMHGQGVPASETLFRILEHLFTEQEASFVSQLPLNFFTLDQAVRITGKTEAEAAAILDGLADKAILVDVESAQTKAYIVSPPMAGFFEFSLMRTDGKFDRQLLSHLFYQYINQEDEFMFQAIGMDSHIIRTFVHEDMIEKDGLTMVLDYEKASHVIESASCITLGTCYCRHKMEHVGKACEFPQDVCMTFNTLATSLSKHGVAREIAKGQALDILHRCMSLGLVQLGDNVQEGVNFMCHCCGCCCEALTNYERLRFAPKFASNFTATIREPSCTGCGICERKCPVKAVTIATHHGRRVAEINREICIGCGVCKRFCPRQSIELERLKALRFVPKDSFERHLVFNIERGCLENLILDNLEFWGHQQVRALLKAILTSAPVKKALLNHRIRSRFINLIIHHTGKYDLYDRLFNDGRKVDYSHPELRQHPS
ncbi:MAG TPA: 4Fe-4S binding protein [Candidatus Ozemobacteraceae bacterium]|nr:4Fe-4S binding protein [Candidatus Ozemobacteraceae bacterium]